jgi:hypothetical protein
MLKRFVFLIYQSSVTLCTGSLESDDYEMSRDSPSRLVEGIKTDAMYYTDIVYEH